MKFSLSARFLIAAISTASVAAQNPTSQPSVIDSKTELVVVHVDVENDARETKLYDAIAKSYEQSGFRVATPNSYTTSPLRLHSVCAKPISVDGNATSSTHYLWTEIIVDRRPPPVLSESDLPIARPRSETRDYSHPLVIIGPRHVKPIWALPTKPFDGSISRIRTTCESILHDPDFSGCGAELKRELSRSEAFANQSRENLVRTAKASIDERIELLTVMYSRAGAAFLASERLGGEKGETSKRALLSLYDENIKDVERTHRLFQQLRKGGELDTPVRLHLLAAFHETVQEKIRYLQSYEYSLQLELLGGEAKP